MVNNHKSVLFLAESPEANGQKEGTLLPWIKLRGDDANPCGVHPGRKVKDARLKKIRRMDGSLCSCRAVLLFCIAGGDVQEGGSGWMGGLPSPTLAC